MLEKITVRVECWTRLSLLGALLLGVTACGADSSIVAESVAGKADGDPGIMVTWRNRMEKFAQTDLDWSQQRLFLRPGCNTMHNGGCAITSRAMVDSYYTSERAHRRDPGELNSCLARAGAYSSKCFVSWTGCLPEGVTYQGSAAARLSTIRADIDAGHPVIAEVPVEGGSHFVVIAGYAFPGTALSQFAINDPACGCTHRLGFYGSVKSLRRFRGPVRAR